MQEQIIEALLPQLGATGLDAAQWGWNIALRGIRTEGLTIVVLSLLATIAAALSVRTAIQSIPKVREYTKFAFSVIGIVAAGAVFTLRDALIMTIAPDYWLFKAGLLSATAGSDAVVVQTPEASLPFVPIAAAIVTVGVVLFAAKIFGSGAQQATEEIDYTHK